MSTSTDIEKTHLINVLYLTSYRHAKKNTFKNIHLSIQNMFFKRSKLHGLSQCSTLASGLSSLRAQLSLPNLDATAHHCEMFVQVLGGRGCEKQVCALDYY